MQRHWSKAVTDYLRHVCSYNWVPIEAVMEHFMLTRGQLQIIIGGNHRMSVRMSPANVEQIRGMRSVNSRTHGR
jgi:hypothetical protein